MTTNDQGKRVEREWRFEMNASDVFPSGCHPGFRSQDDEGEFNCIVCDPELAAPLIAALERENAALRAANDSLRTAEGEAMLVLESTEYKLEQSESRAKAAEQERDRLRALVEDTAFCLRAWMHGSHEMMQDPRMLDAGEGVLARAEQEVKQ